MARRKTQSLPAEPTNTIELVEIAPSSTANEAPAPTAPVSDSALTFPPTDTEAAKPSYGPNPFPIASDVLAGVRLLEDRRFHQMQLKFDLKPSKEVRQIIRDAGFQWRNPEQAWTKQLNSEPSWRTRADAKNLFQKVSGMIRDERDLGRQVG